MGGAGVQAKQRAETVPKCRSAAVSYLEPVNEDLHLLPWRQLQLPLLQRLVSDALAGSGQQAVAVSGGGERRRRWRQRGAALRRGV